MKKRALLLGLLMATSLKLGAPGKDISSIPLFMAQTACRACT